MKELEERRRELLERFPAWEPATLYRRFAETAVSCPQAPFLIDGEKSFSYGEILRQADRARAAFAALGLCAGERVAVLLGNGAPFVVLTFALAGCGAVKVPVNRNAGREELSYILTQTGARFLVAEDGGEAPSFGGQVIAVRNAAAGQLSWEQFLESGSESPSEPADENPDSLCDIIYTSGSTGCPKGVMLTHDMIWRAAFANCLNRGFEPGRRIYVPLPLFHVYGYVEGLLAAVLVQGAVIVSGGHFEAARALHIIEETRANDILCVPSVMIKILQEPTLADFDLSSLHGVYCSASICPKWVWSAIREKLGVQEVVTGYGMTEVSGASMQTDPQDGVRILESRVGHLLDGGPAGPVAQYRVVGENGRELSAGECGSLLCCGPIVTAGYYHDEEATKRAFSEDGWLITGDVGCFDEQGYLRYLGRSNDIYKINGENVSPQYLDKVISRCPFVTAVETIGVPHEALGWVGAAFIDAGEADEKTREAIKNYCEETLAPYQVPRYYFFTDSRDWPRTTTGKVQKYKLRQLARERMEERNG